MHARRLRGERCPVDPRVAMCRDGHVCRSVQECRARTVHVLLLVTCVELFRTAPCKRDTHTTRWLPEYDTPWTVERSTQVARRQASHKVVRSTRDDLRRSAQSERVARWPRRILRVPCGAAESQRASAIASSRRRRHRRVGRQDSSPRERSVVRAHPGFRSDGG